MKADLTIKNYRCFEDTQPLQYTLTNGYTAFVGPNNSGKSSILKFFHEFRNYWGMLSPGSGNFTHALRGNPQGSNFQGVIDQTEVFSNLNPRDIEVDIVFSSDDAGISQPPKVSKLGLIIRRSGAGATVKIWTPNQAVDTSGDLAFNGNILRDARRGNLADLSPVFELSRLVTQAIYIGAFRNTINVGAGAYFDIQVGTAFIETWHQWKTGPSKANNERIQNVSRDIQQIFRHNQLEIIAAKESNTLQINADGKPYKLHELGGGIAQFIVVLGNVAIREPSFILIDEPELNLHPSRQLDFLTSLGAYSKAGVLFATHSLGLARSAADRIYSVQTVDGRALLRPFEQTPNLTEFLGELNFAGFRELGFDKVLLVEGVTDVRTVQQFLRSLKKDHRILLLPLGGGQMIKGSREAELAEIMRITSKVAALIDSEREEGGAALNPNREAFCETCQRLGVRILALERRAIENYFTEQAIQEVKGPTYRALQPFQALRNAERSWGKHENWRIARAMKFDDIRNTDLGRFLEQL